METQYSDSIAKTLLFNPIELGCNKLCILSYHATPSMVSWLLKTYEEQGITNVSVELIVENVINDGIDLISHAGFKELHTNNTNFSCCYLFQSPMSKRNLFIWLHDDKPIQAFSCSYDFTQQSLLRKRGGSHSVCSATNAYKNYEDAVNRSIYCNHSEVEDYIVIDTKLSPASKAYIRPDNCVHLSFITRTGETGKRSGLNWGQRNNRNKNEAYIPLPSKIAKSGFFPLNKQHFLVVTDEHHTLQLRVEQQNDKAITTPASNALLGEYFRNRLGLANGSYVFASDLRAYGRTDVAFYKIDEEQYYMDFSVGNYGR